MKRPSPPVIAATLLCVLAVAGIALLRTNEFWLGELSITLRTALVLLPLLAAIAACFLLLHYRQPAIMRHKARLFLLSVFAVLTLPATFAWLRYWIPAESSPALSFSTTMTITEQHLITDSSSNALVEIGFSYPIFTPAVTIRNGERYSRQLEVYLHMEDANGEQALYRAVRDQTPAGNLSVETSVRGMLSANPRYIFLPLALAPGDQITGRLVFIITTLEDGASFLETLRQATLTQFELRDAKTGELLSEVPIQN